MARLARGDLAKDLGEGRVGDAGGSVICTPVASPISTFITTASAQPVIG
jgi:hypothetical protein